MPPTTDQVPLPSPEPFLQSLREWNMPTQAQYLDYLQSMGIVQAMILLVVGVVYLLYGWKIFKILVVINAAVLGGLLGAKAGSLLQGANMPLFGGIAVSLLLAVLALPLMKYSVSLMGGLAGSLLGYSVWHYVCNAAKAPHLAQYSWAGALIGLIALGLLAFIIFRAVIIIFTSFQGAFVTVTGIVGVLMLFESARQYLVTSLTNNIYLLPMLVLVPGIIGVAFQSTGKGSKAPAAVAKKPAPA